MLQYRLQIYEESGVLILPEEIAAVWPIAKEPAVMLRVRGPHSEFARLKYLARYSGLLEQKFEDDHIASLPNTFSEEQADEAAAFLWKHRKAQSFVFHCHAGYSRSAAQAQAWLEYMGSKQAQVVAESRSVFGPNRLVLDRMRVALVKLPPFLPDLA